MLQPQSIFAAMMDAGRSRGVYVGKVNGKNGMWVISIVPDAKEGGLKSIPFPNICSRMVSKLRNW